MKWLISAFILICTTEFYTQTSKPDTIVAHYSRESIQVDGKLDENAWQQARHIHNFTQRELNVGEPGTERTEVAIVYTAETFIGFWGTQ